jgi:hypothetical protein
LLILTARNLSNVTTAWDRLPNDLLDEAWALVDARLSDGIGIAAMCVRSSVKAATFSASSPDVVMAALGGGLVDRLPR